MRIGRRTRNGMVAAVIAGLLAVPGFALAAQRTGLAGAPAPADRATKGVRS